ncbi:putative TIM-barrel protein [Methanococcus vannielii SB]|uniref:TIM-barrel protein n=1 Tax=Methanococcus vannielii (strain ATCC 35089 / DSM 1224 / JCM 13029 / OCM 148 / SB) TaxID=406327 RepID=A6US19_METVS|nr:MJ0144 family RNA dihydrouridine synthase-like protein [Methanococcus vannielii]ABR55291.1 putative TIM-barrel protein [Methanococcus vannielii SB]
MKNLNKIYKLDKKIVLAPMAGITDGDFCKNYTDLFGITCIGAFNLDSKTDIASKSILKRGRKEFIYDLEDLSEKIVLEIKKAKESKSLVSVNVRFDDFLAAKKTLVQISKYADIIEINCHCRQEEITNLNLGQNLLKLENNLKLKEILTQIDNLNLKTPIFLKIRANFVNFEELTDSLNNVKDYFEGIHIDCFNPKKNYPDLDYLKKVWENFNEKIIIGNNSVNSIESAKKMIEYCDFVSVARSVISKNIEWIYEFNKLMSETKK